MNSRTFLIHFLVALCSALLIPILINFLVDPYDVFGHRLLPEYGGIQERYLKTEYLRNNKQFDTFLLGSSRLGSTPTEYVTEYCNCRPYNLSVAVLNQWENLEFVKWLLATQPNIRNLLIQIDVDQLILKDPAPRKEVHVKPAPELTGENKYLFLLPFLSSISIPAMEQKLRNNFGEHPSFSYSIEKGYYSYPQKDLLIDTDCADYFSTHPNLFSSSNNPSNLTDQQKTNITLSIKYLEEVNKLSSANGVRTYFFLTPIHRAALDAIPLDGYLQFLGRLADISPVVNFSYYSERTSNHCNYYDEGHYRAVLAKEVIHDLWNNQKLFGRPVSSVNINDELDFLSRNFMENRKPSRNQSTNVQSLQN